MTELITTRAPAKAGAQSDGDARSNASGAKRRVWTPAFAGAQEGTSHQ